MAPHGRPPSKGRRSWKPSRPESLSRRKVRGVVGTLAREYGSPGHNNKRDPLDELVFIILSQRTTGPSFNRVFDRLKASCPSWSFLVTMPIRRLKVLIKDAGLSNQKGPRLKRIIKRIVEDFGRPTLRPLRRMSDEQAERYLTSLPGVGIKTAKCVLMYSLDRQVLPVDTHVARVASRLGFLPPRIHRGTLHPAIERVVPPPDRYSFHVNALAHGREVCLPLRPRCAACKLQGLCPTGNHPQG